MLCLSSSLFNMLAVYAPRFLISWPSPGLSDAVLLQTKLTGEQLRHFGERLKTLSSLQEDNKQPQGDRKQLQRDRKQSVQKTGGKAARSSDLVVEGQGGIKTKGKKGKHATSSLVAAESRKRGGGGGGGSAVAEETMQELLGAFMLTPSEERQVASLPLL